VWDDDNLSWDTKTVKKLCLDVDKGVPCWEMFLDYIEYTFPSIETLHVHQNYTHHAATCIKHPCEKSPNGINQQPPDIVDAFKESTVKYLYVFDQQTEFGDGFYGKDSVDPNLFSLVVENRTLSITRVAQSCNFIQSNVLVMDFASFYPSLMISVGDNDDARDLREE
jgi:hypothetical protein